MHANHSTNHTNSNATIAAAKALLLQIEGSFPQIAIMKTGYSNSYTLKELAPSKSNTARDQNWNKVTSTSVTMEKP
jgi:hypothetical protein